MKNSYVEYVILEHLLDGNFDAQFDNQWIDEEEFNDLVARIPFEAFAAYGIRAVGKYSDISQSVIDELIKLGGFTKRGDQYAGYWYHLNIKHKDLNAQRMLEDNDVRKRLNGLPDAALTRALDEIAREDGLKPLYIEEEEVAELSDAVSAEIVPAADRVVTLKHNQQSQIEEPLNEILTLVEAENSIDGEDGLRELVLGRLRAGRELVRAGIFSVRSLQLTLIVGLQMLVEKYREMAIGIVAAKLLDLLIEQYGVG